MEPCSSKRLSGSILFLYLQLIQYTMYDSYSAVELKTVYRTKHGINATNKVHCYRVLRCESCRNQMLLNTGICSLIKQRS